jgi:DNA-binding transcriptional MerR regulator
MNLAEYRHTSTSLGRVADLTAETVRLYADNGLIECIRLPNGVRLFTDAAAQRAREIKAQRMANRGGARRGSKVA